MSRQVLVQINKRRFGEPLAKKGASSDSFACNVPCQPCFSACQVGSLAWELEGVPRAQGIWGGGRHQQTDKLGREPTVLPAAQGGLRPPAGCGQHGLKQGKDRPSA